MFGLSFHKGDWVPALDNAPNGGTTMTETIDPALYQQLSKGK